MELPRTEKIEALYQQFKSANPQSDTLNVEEETVVRSFIHWIIIQNRFPYDRMVRTNHMLISKRTLGRLSDATKEEQDEYYEILRLLSEEEFYDAVIENFPKVKSIKNHFHIHLVQWHVTES